MQKEIFCGKINLGGKIYSLNNVTVRGKDYKGLNNLTLNDFKLEDGNL